MKYLDEFRDGRILQGIADQIRASSPPPLNFMEVCGTHTMAIAHYGIRSLLPPQIQMLSGPGCPVCVTPQAEIDWFLALGRIPDVILATFGDMVRVPGTNSNLEMERARGAEVRVVYSPLDALTLARENKGRQVAFFGIGFETTAPAVALTILEAQRQEISNFSVLCAHKLIPAALRALSSAPDLNINGFLCPGHVSVIIGSRPYQFVAEEFGIPCVIGGFEPTDIMQAIALLVNQSLAGEAKVEVQYSRAVREGGSPRAQKVISQTFQIADAQWRGLGVIPQSGLELKAEFGDFDARRRFEIEVPESRDPPGCDCGEILRGAKSPPECALFGKSCTPSHPIGPCMVSSEGACAAHYRYRKSPE